MTEHHPNKVITLDRCGANRSDRKIALSGKMEAA
jgi:hypothetical protein